ncbi:hypothetical protein EOD41_00710 [Mucilaginibacter limnophilus]|uniref:Glucose/Sorbosone dehydrogenase domain-containing protein n=1 Tax=Mucilaginibacter limnophilus TaxID=1932778 RepID=A0A3S2Y395_9SPHI|nr:PQQ-dependent sugar dehydrogenase [Mucilaginibacter limnophilus]RVU02494.1 hypothetical protein EOD41_00710 [Mucilaginibacter limnophilus]
MAKKILLLVYFTTIYCGVKAQTFTGPAGEIFKARIIAGKLSDPWEITYGPDNKLWITEAKTYRVWSVNPSSGSKKLLLDINDFEKFPPAKTKGLPQARLMGMALHPQLLKGQPYVYVAYIKGFPDSNTTGCKVNKGGCIAVTAIARYTYNASTQTLSNPAIICDTIPGSNDHNGGRLIVAPVGAKVIFFTVLVIWAPASLTMAEGLTTHNKLQATRVKL